MVTRSERVPARRTGSGAPAQLQDFMGESFLFLGAGSTVLLQLANPGVGHGVADHSTTLVRPLDRLRTTMTFVYAVTLGTPVERKAIASMVNKVHVPVRSTTYNAFDPELQLWVAATLYKNSADLCEWFLGAPDEDTADRIYQQSAVYGTALQVRPDMWPATRADFERYWQEQLAACTVDDHVREYVHALMRGGQAPFLVRRLQLVQRFFTTGLLPQQLREKFALPWSPADQRRFDRVMRVLPPLYRLAPRPLRQLPARLYLADMRRRLNAHQHVI